MRATFSEIAEDEAHHAALAWAVDAWACSRLDEDAVRRVRAARDEAAAAIVRDAARGALSPETRRVTGMPSADDARALARSLERTLFAGELA